MMLRILLALLVTAPQSQRAAAPACQAQENRRAESIHGAIRGGEKFVQTTASGWVLRLEPGPGGWFLEVTTKGREEEDLSRLTPPWHFVPNPREIEAWHFRNADNTGPNDGSVNAPQELREFIFSPAVGREIEYHGSGTTPEDVEKVRAFGRGWLLIESYELTPPQRDERAAFKTMSFSACLTWPSSSAMIEVIPRESVDLGHFICPCEFDLGDQIDGETALIIDHNGADQAAFVRIDGSTLRLAKTSAFRFQCKPHEEISASWEGGGATVRVELKVDRPGEEACSFRGSLSVTKGDRSETRPIIGACGC